MACSFGSYSRGAILVARNPDIYPPRSELGGEASGTSIV